MLVAPAATATVLVKRFAPMLFVAAGLAVASGIGGLYVSYYANTAAGASIAGVTVVLYAVIGIVARTTDATEYYVAGRRVPAMYNGMATAADWMSAASFIETLFPNHSCPDSWTMM